MLGAIAQIGNEIRSLMRYQAVVPISRRTFNNSLGSVANVDFQMPFDKRFSQYLIVLSNVIPVTNGAALHALLSSDGGLNWGASLYDYAGSYTQDDGSETAIAGNAQAQIVLTGDMHNNTGLAASLTFTPSLNANHGQWLRLSGSYGDSTALRAADVTVSAKRTTVARYNALRLQMSSGNIHYGDFMLYGLRIPGLT